MNTPVILLFSNKWVPGLAEEDNSTITVSNPIIYSQHQYPLSNIHSSDRVYRFNHSKQNSKPRILIHMKTQTLNANENDN